MFKKGEENEQKNRLSPYITCKGTLYTKDMHICVEILHMSGASRCCSWIHCFVSKVKHCFVRLKTNSCHTLKWLFVHRCLQGCFKK